MFWNFRFAVIPLIIIPLFMCGWDNAYIHSLWQKNVIFSFCSSSSCFCPLTHGKKTSMYHLLRHILSASSSLDVCIFAFTNTDLSRAVLALRSRGVAIRVLVEEKNVSMCGSQIPVLLGAGKRFTADATFIRHPQTRGDPFSRGNAAETNVTATFARALSQTVWVGNTGSITEALCPKSLCVLRLLLSGSLGEVCAGEWRHNSSCLGEWRLPLHALPWVRVIALPTRWKIVRCRSESRRLALPLSLLHFINYCSCILLDWELTK